MDYSMGLVSAILAICIFFPFFYAGLLGSRKKNQLKKRVQKVLDDKGVVLTLKEYWGNSFIGINADKGILFFIKFTNKGLVIKEIGISDLHSCEVVKHTVKQKDKSRPGFILLRLELVLVFKGNGGPEVHLTFFDREEDDTEHYEEERAERWKSKLMLHRVRDRRSRSVA
jgi:hypothetical protein